MIRKLYGVFPYCPYCSNPPVFHLSICYSLRRYLLQSFFGFPAHLQQITLPFCNFRIFGSRSSVSCIQLQGLQQSRICFLRTASGPTAIAVLFPAYSFRAYGNPSLRPAAKCRSSLIFLNCDHPPALRRFQSSKNHPHSHKSVLTGTPAGSSCPYTFHELVNDTGVIVLTGSDCLVIIGNHVFCGQKILSAVICLQYQTVLAVIVAADRSPGPVYHDRIIFLPVVSQVLYLV